VTIAVVDYGIGNQGSVMKAFRHLGAPAILSGDIAELRRADVLVLPGDGAFASTMQEIESRGLVPVLREAVDQGRTLLGICIGMQLLFERSEESPEARGFGLLPGTVRRFVERPGLKIPHMGWNRTRRGPAGGPVAAGVPDGAFFYFIHSYYPDPARAEDVALTSDHGQPFCAAVARDNVFGCQFHPEKSQAAGLALLRSFASVSS
jgi:glutamine amidotransferase